MDLSERVYQQTRKKYEEGLGSNLEITTALSDQKTAQANYFNALYNAVIARVDYLTAIGKTINQKHQKLFYAKDIDHGCRHQLFPLVLSLWQWTKERFSEGKKAQLTALKDQQDKLTKQISSLEDEIGKSDTTSGTKEKAKLVALTALTPTSFTHYIDLQGNVEAENSSFISPRATGGVVRQVNVKQGDHVNKGQVLLKLDDAVQRQQVTNAQTQVAYAKDIYQRRKNLWDQKIGTEVDFINAKNQVDQAETQLKIARNNWTSPMSMQISAGP